MRSIKLLIVTTFLLFFFSHFDAAAQTVTDANFITVSTQNAGYYSAISLVTVSDTSNIAEIEIKIGTANGLTDVVNYSFVFGQTSGLPTGYSYSRNGYKLNLGMNTVQATGPFFSQIRLKYTNNSWSPSFDFITN